MTAQQPKKRQSKRKTSKDMQRVYLRRRIVVGVVALALLALIGFGVYTLATKVIATHGGQSSSNSVSESRKKTLAKKPGKSDNNKNNQDDKANQGGVRKCGAKDVKLELSPISQSVELGGSLDFKATIRYEGNDSCVVDASNASRILTIYTISDEGSASGSDSDSGNGSASKSGSDTKSKSDSSSKSDSNSKSGSSSGTSNDGSNSEANDDADAASSEQTGDTIWSSAVCPADSRKLLMAKGDKDAQKITWPADKTGSTCVPDEQLPRVKRGVYLAQLSLKDHPNVKSEKVPIIVK
ncbi:hypothetical protein OZX74_01900 [Bifidobacterium sp. ESL0798]|uniref:hypothetical protein n=1 Tax=Bifidobacterium sp. ESL0798 TaxID=2983235 RepID=UPI0023F7B568|nr:hypothetical protein [Bifidobacterium sp. ESL0798]WEV74332.1 hypothetical protein OZX74_01900 [Bifidobacterium sp. ESL0798]